MSTAVDDGLLRSNPVAIKGAAAEEHHARPGSDLRRGRPARRRDRAEVPCADLDGGDVSAPLQRADRVVPLPRRPRARRPFGSSERWRSNEASAPTLGPPKTPAAHRTVALPGRHRRDPPRHLDEFVDGTPDALVFTSVKGSPLLYRYFAPYWKRAKAGGRESIRPSTSTTSATWPAPPRPVPGASVKELMARMGHATSDASLRYLEASARRDAEIAAAMEERIAHCAQRAMPDGTASAQHLGAPVVEPRPISSGSKRMNLPILRNGIRRCATSRRTKLSLTSSIDATRGMSYNSRPDASPGLNLR